MRDALEQIDLPTYVIETDGTLQWANSARSTLIGERVGQSFLAAVPRAIYVRARKRISSATLSRTPWGVKPPSSRPRGSDVR
jgi:hypothetical protein